MKVASVKIIGCGNRHRGDDQAGILVVERLRELGFEADLHTGDALALIERWRSNDDVILVDAVVTGAPVGTVHVWDSNLAGSGLPNGARDAAVSSHGFDFAKAIELGRTLGKFPARLRVYGIEGRQFERGSAISRAVLAAIDSVVTQVSDGIPALLTTR
ncbi:MAG: hydrogenase maturation protease [Terriglobales bacterium]